MAELPGNQTPNTPQLSETELRRMRLDEVREIAKEYGISGASNMRKEELVDAISEAARRQGRFRREDAAEERSRGRERAAAGGRSAAGERSARGGGGSGGGKEARTAEPPGNQTPDTPELSETELRRMRLDEVREIAKEYGISGASSMRKEELVDAISEAARRQGRFRREDEHSAERQRSSERERSSGRGRRRGGGGDGGDAESGGGVRTGRETSKSMKYAQEVASPEEEPERPGRSLVTTNHEVIRRWAEERGATPATVEGTEHGDHLGVLTFDFGDPDERLRHVSWDEWFKTFDERRLNFIYQETLRDGRQSNFFRLESPEREDA